MIYEDEESMWVEQGVCELCDETALPYDEYHEYAWCAEHSMQMYVGAGLPDFLIDAEDECDWESFKVHRGDLSYDERCLAAGFSHRPGVTVPRHKSPEDVPNLLMKTADLCPQHAMQRFGPEAPLTGEEWVMVCQPGYEEDF